MATNDKSDMEYIRNYIKYSLLNKSHFFDNSTVWAEIADLIKKTLVDGESNSGLLIGPRGSGKTTLVKDVLNSIQNETVSNDYILIKLHGLVHTNDHLAVNSIASQMALETVVEGRVFGSFADNLTFLISCIKSGQKHKSKRLIIILEEFDLFCSHHNQTLLYNLFDLSQSAEAPICILGITCRLDVIELLEKRVKSRFSHRQYFLHPVLPIEGYPFLEHAVQIISRHLKLPQERIDYICEDARENWNNDLKTFLDNKKFREILQRIIDINNTEAILKNILLNIVFNLKENSKLTAELFQEQLNLLEKDDTIQVLQDLTVLELCLLIAMKHHAEIYDNQPMNFEMILKRYIKFVNSNSNIQTIQRPVIMKAFEHIQKLELISPISSGGPRLKEYQYFKLLITPQQLAEGIKKYVGLPTEVVHWANSSLA